MSSSRDPHGSGRPNVAVVVSQLGRGGAERQTVELLRALSRTAWRPAVVICLSTDTRPFDDDVRRLGYRMEVVARSSSFDWRRLFRLRHSLVKYRIRIVHAVHLLASGYCFLATRGMRSCAVLPSIRGTVVNPGPFRWFVYRWMFHSCGRALANSHLGAEFIERKFRVPKGRISVVPNGINFAALRNRAAEIRVRETLEIPESAPIVAYVGKNSTVKNVPRFLAMWESVAEANPLAHAVLVGGGLGPDGASALLGNCPPSRTHFLGPRDDVPALLSQADVLALTSNSEGAPNVVLEALALGTPVVSTDVGDVKRMVRQGVTGFVEGSGTPSALADAVTRVLASRERFREAVLENLAPLESTYTVDAMVANTVGLWAEIAPRV